MTAIENQAITLLTLFCRSSEITDDEYTEFYKSICKDSEEPMAKVHFTAEGEVTFKSILYVPKTGTPDLFQNYGKRSDHIKVSFRVKRSGDPENILIFEITIVRFLVWNIEHFPHIDD